jgi:hypothetical protein
MKKTIITLTIILGMTLSTFADGGLFQRGNNAKNGFSGYSLFGSKPGDDNNDTEIYPLLPIHDLDDDQPAPLGSGIAVLMGLGVAYMVVKKRREE